MDLSEKLIHDMKSAMKDGDKQKLNTIRQIRAQIKNEQIEANAELDDSAILDVLANAAKKRKDAMQMYKKGGRDDLYVIEEAELKIIQSYLPRQMSDDEIAAMVESVILDVGATSQKDFGTVMKAVMTKSKGRADGSKVQQLVRTKLS